MRPLILTITAFGPYATKQVIDFTQLQGRNLFVITGDTGAGKTTILDAIAYALYGRASGRDRDGDSLRSHFAATDVLTVVEMEFELRGERYWVQRIPKQRRKRTRGEGYTDQIPEAEFKNLTKESPLVTGFKEVSEKIVALLGLSYEQFKQIIMIPQGEFRELLNADSKTRQDILQKIFGTEGLRRVQELFESKAKELVQEAGTLENQRDECIRNVDTTAYLPLAEMLAAGAYHVPLVVEEIKNGIGADICAAKELAEEIQGQEEQILAKQGEIFQGQANNVKLSVCEETYQKKLAMEARSPEMDEKKQTLYKARKALSLVGPDEYQGRRREQVEKKKLELIEAVEQEKTRKTQVTLTGERYNQEKGQESKGQELLARQVLLEGLRDKVADWDTQHRKIDSLEQALVAAKNERDTIKQRLEQTREENTAYQVKLSEARESVIAYGQKNVELEKISELYNKFTALTTESARFVQLQQSLLKLGKKEAHHRLQYEQSQVAYEQAQMLFLEGQAGLLAARLQPEEQCPVCGSAHHPKLAVVLENIPSEEDLKELINQDKQARELYHNIKEQYERTKGDHYAQEQILVRLLQELGLAVDQPITEIQVVEVQQYGAEKLSEYAQLIQGLKNELKKLVTQKNTELEIAATLQENVASIGSLGTALEAVEEQYTSLFAQVQSGKDAIKKVEAEVPVEIRSVKALAQELAVIQQQLQQRKDRLGAAEQAYTNSQVRYAAAVADQHSAEKNLQESVAEFELGKEQFSKALAAAGFIDETAYQKAKLTEKAINNLENEINHYQEELRSTSDAYLLAQQAIAGISLVDVKVLEEEQVNLQTEKNRLLTARTTLIARQTHNQSMLATIDSLMKKIGKKDEEHQLIGHLAKIAKGDNEQKVSFERYVLAAFFNDIIDAANLRLKKMTNGRYQMSRIVQKGKGSGQSGLEIEVFDYYTGQSRHVKTLSGGESFKASLALALGLAEVVQSYAGGISLETMFVDEGFGTLDPESLDTAIACLIDLQHSGRLVGIISHVPELKTNIDVRLEIAAGKAGSTAQFYIL